MIDNFLPSSWVLCKFGDIAKIKNGYAFKSKCFKKNNILKTDIPLVKQSQLRGTSIDLSDAIYLDSEYAKSHKNYLLKKDDVLIGMSGSIGKVCIYDYNFPALQNQRTGKIVPHLNNILNNKFFWIYLSNIEQVLIKQAKGMGVQNISAKDIEALNFPLPPLNEQKRIVVKIEELFSELDNGIQNLKTAKNKLKLYRQSVLKHAFEGKLTEKWREEHQDKLPSPETLLEEIKHEREKRYEKQLEMWKEGKKPKKPKKNLSISNEEFSQLASIPHSWQWSPFNNIVMESVLGKMLDKKKNRGTYKPYLRNINVRWGKFNLNDIYDMRIEDSEQQRFELLKNDLIICEGGEPGRCAIWKDEQTEMYLQKALHRVRFPLQYINNKFVYFFIVYANSNGHLAKFFTGTTIKHLTGQGLSNFQIPICSKEEQNQIVQEIESRLSIVERLELDINENLKKSESLRQSILKKAFEGKLVEQDINDESADKLLTRIKALAK